MSEEIRSDPWGIPTLHPRNASPNANLFMAGRTALLRDATLERDDARTLRQIEHTRRDGRQATGNRRGCDVNQGRRNPRQSLVLFRLRCSPGVTDVVGQSMRIGRERPDLEREPPEAQARDRRKEQHEGTHRDCSLSSSMLPVIVQRATA